MTSLTGSLPDSPNVPASRVVVNTRIPHCSKSGTTSFGTSSTLLTAIVDAGDRGSQRVEAFVDTLVTALDLSDVVDEARPVGAERREEKRHSSANVRRFQERPSQSRRAGNQRAVRIAEHDSRAHG